MRVEYQAQFDLPDLIERGRSTTLACRVSHAGTLAAPASGTVAVYDAAGTAVASGSVTVSSGVATYSVLGTLTDDLSLDDGWRVAWTLTMPDGIVHEFANEAALVRCAPAPSVTEAVLYARCPSLDPVSPNAISRRVEYSQQIREAWVELSQALLAEGWRPELVLSPSALRKPHALLTLALIFDDLATRNNPAFVETARSYREQYSAAFAAMRPFRYDADDDGVPDGPTRPAKSSVWLK
jgi:hypothetical protein